MGGEDRFDGGGRGFHGQVEIGAGVPVGDGIDVDRVDRRPLPAERFEGQGAPAPYRDGIRFVGGLRHLGSSSDGTRNGDS